MEQTYRDQRLNMIHEGTNGIQSLDLLGRKAKPGLPVLNERMMRDIENAKNGDPGLQDRALKLEQALERINRVTDALIGQKSPTTQVAFANSHEYLNMVGHIVIAWMWLRQEAVACQFLQTSPNESRKEFLLGKRLTSEYFFNHELPKTETQARLLISLDDTVLRMQNAFF